MTAEEKAKIPPEQPTAGKTPSEKEECEERLDEVIEESFPASDPPPMGGPAGAPKRPKLPPQ
jgi:hypothetical protein